VEWVYHGTGPEVTDLARQIQQQCFDSGFSLLATISAFVAASQSIEYVDDQSSTDHDEYWRFPIETIADGKGDCEDSAILLSALLRRGGYRVSILLAPGHAAVGVEVPLDTPGTSVELDGIRYYYCETTELGWTIGDLPADVDTSALTVVPVDPWPSA
jgi:hypothetical protein